MTIAVLKMNAESYREDFLNSLLGAEYYGAKKILRSALKELSAEDVLLKVVTPALNLLGEKWAEKEIALTQLYVASRITEDAISKLLPLIREYPPLKYKAVIGTISGDYHALGKDVVIRFLRAAGVEVKDLGVSVEPEVFVEKAVEEKADLIFVSALMLHTALRIADIAKILREKKLSVKLVVGGAPFNFDKNLHKKLGAHAMVRNALDGINIVKKLMEGNG